MDNIELKPKTLFDHINAILKYRDPDYYNNLSDADKKTWNVYMINRFLSMEYSFIEYVNQIDILLSYGTIPSELIYKLYIGIIPKSNKFLKYMKSETTEKYTPELLGILQNHFNVSKIEAIDYIRIFRLNSDNENKLKELISKYGYTEAEIKKIVKG